MGNKVQLRWATLGVGVIGHQLADAMQALGGNLYAVGNRTHEKAVAFAKEYGIGKVYDQPEDMFQDPDVDIVYVSTPHNTHIQYLRQALAAGKHVLCESSCPDELLTQVNYAETGVDEQASLLLKTQEAQMATVMLSLHSKQPKRGTLSFDKAYVELFEYPRGDRAVITWTEDGRKEEVLAGSTAEALQYEVLDMERAVSGDPSVMHLDYTRDVMKLMTKARDVWGMKYPEEE